MAAVEERRESWLRLAAIGAIVLSLVISAAFGFLHRTLGGPGDQLLYYTQAGHLTPFVDHYYGPGYFVVLRLLKGASGLEWFAAGKLLSWLSAAGFLLCSYRLLIRVLPGPYCYAAVILVALNPTVITMSYSSLTVMFGALTVTAAVVLLLEAEKRSNFALASGFVFALASLSRFQANGFFLGALAGTLIWGGLSFRRRLVQAGKLLIAFLLPMVAWYGYLKVSQGGAPANHNFVHLTLALGRFREFSEVEDLIRTYGSMTGVLQTPGAIPAILRMLAAETLKFPFRNGVELLFLAAAWLVPAACLVVAQPKLWRPWLLALAAGFVATNLSSRGWVYYYLPVMPGLAYLVCLAASQFDQAAPAAARRIQWIAILGVLFVATPIRARAMFRELEWPEWRTAREYLRRTTGPLDLVTSTAGSLPYGLDTRFIDQDQIYRVKRLDQFVERLRGAGVTTVVVTDRHSLDEHPELEPLLRDDPSGIPAGLHRDTLLLQPRRLAILRVTAP